MSHLHISKRLADLPLWILPQQIVAVLLKFLWYLIGPTPGGQYHDSQPSDLRTPNLDQFQPAPLVSMHEAENVRAWHGMGVSRSSEFSRVTEWYLALVPLTDL